MRKRYLVESDSRSNQVTDPSLFNISKYDIDIATERFMSINFPPRGRKLQIQIQFVSGLVLTKRLPFTTNMFVNSWFTIIIERLEWWFPSSACLVDEYFTID